MKKALRTKMQ